MEMSLYTVIPNGNEGSLIFAP